MIDTTLDDEAPAIRAAVTDYIRENFRTLPAHQALQLSDGVLGVLIEKLGGCRLSVAKSKDGPDYSAARKDWEHGMSASEVQRKHGISRRSFYRHVRDAA